MFLFGLGLLLSGTLLLPAAVAGVGNRDGGAGAANSPLRIVGAGDARMVDGVVIVKFAAPQAIGKGVSRTGLSSLDRILDAQGAYAIERAFPLPDRALGPKGMELQRVYYVRYGSGENPRSVALKIARDPGVEYAVPQYVHRIDDPPPSQPVRANRNIAVDPNDPLYSDMTHLAHIRAPEAWGEVKGEDGNVVIAIVDGGTDWQHEDLVDNIWQNLGEDADGDGHTLEYVDGEWVLDPGDLDGKDNDLNEFTDDLIGWNFANDSNDPTGLSSAPLNAEHGTAVAGVASAVTDNGIGIAGAAWNAQIMPINVSWVLDSFIYYGYEGIIYAALNGADIINASWGSRYDDITPFEERLLLEWHQLLTDFLAEYGALLVSSAGNAWENNDTVLNLPAGAPHVLAVGATGKVNDIKAGWSNYGVSVDVFAPGVSIDATAPDNDYFSNVSGTVSGTSFSAPLVSGIAALVKTRFPYLSPDQLAQQLRVTADPIDNDNLSLKGLLGKGRVNAYRAVTDSTIPAIRIAGVSFQDSDADGRIESGETVDVTVALTNYLADAHAVTLNLILDDPKVTITNGESSITSLPSGKTAYADFRFTVDQVGKEYPLRFILDITSGGYQDRDLIRLYANEPLVLTHNTDSLRVSLTEEGNIGWIGFAEVSPGEGFVYHDTNLLFEGGLLVGTSSSRVSDCIRGVNEKLEMDFGSPPGSEMVIAPGQVANEEGSVVLTDHLASLPLGVTIQQDSYADNRPDYNDFVIFRYIITNSGESTLSNLYAGLFFDWDLNEYAADFARFDQARRMGIVQNKYSNPTYLAATRLLTGTDSLSYRSIDNYGEIYGGDTGDGFTTSEKWSFLSGGIQTTSLNAVDVSTMTAAGPFVIEPGQAVQVAFAVIGAGSQTALETSADNAQQFWNTPVFTTVLPDTTILSNETLAFAFSACDLEGDKLAFSPVDPPQNASIDSETGLLTFQPPIDLKAELTTFIITVAVSDGVFSSTTSAEVTVEKVSDLLSQNYPNPLDLSGGKKETMIEYYLTVPGNVKLVVYDLLGREVKTLVNETREAGPHPVSWNARDNQGRLVSAGLYLYRIQAGDFIATRKLVVLK